VRTTWCGGTVIQERKSKKAFRTVAEFPANLCPVCRGAHQKMAAEVRAAALEFEHGCEVCRGRPATTIFDRRQVCAACRARLEGHLVKEGGAR
jgi:hypothetical protein